MRLSSTAMRVLGILRRAGSASPGSGDVDGLLDSVYRELGDTMPHQRFGYATIDDDAKTAVTRWVRSDRDIVLSPDFSAPLAESTLKLLVERRCSRILGDLRQYVVKRPSSMATAAIVAEGFQSSLTCPVIVGGGTVGFLFFNSDQAHAFDHDHAEAGCLIAEHVAEMLKTGCLTDEARSYEERAGPGSPQLRAGQRVEHAICDSSGTVLVPAGTVLTDELIVRLGRYGARRGRLESREGD